MSKDGTTPCCPKKIEALISNENSAFTASDKEWLEAQDEATVDKLVAMVNATTTAKDETTQAEQEVAKLISALGCGIGEDGALAPQGGRPIDRHHEQNSARDTGPCRLRDRPGLHGDE